MQIWTCSGCGQTVYFDNHFCVRCQAALGFLPDRLQLVALIADGDGLWRLLGDTDGTAWRSCGNGIHHSACNWLVAADDPQALCRACRLNRTIPDLSDLRNLQLWKRLEAEKRRLVYGLLRLGLPLVDRGLDSDQGLAYDFLADADPQFRESAEVVTGHAQGLITINIAEADDAVRERMRQEMAEPYRTILGHFRHESGHYYWDRLVAYSGWLQPVRERFGDERKDYDAALQRHYRDGPPPDWQQRFVSHYASSHPWEDWAESWAHYLHIVDTLETAWQYGMRVIPAADDAERSGLLADADPYRRADFESLIDDWLPLTEALNELNRSMGQADAYPFVLAPSALDKLGLVHRLIREAGTPRAPLESGTSQGS